VLTCASADRNNCTIYAHITSECAHVHGWSIRLLDLRNHTIANVEICIRAYVHTCIRAYVHTHTHTHTHYPCMHTHIHTFNVHSCTHKQTNKQAHTHIHTERHPYGLNGLCLSGTAHTTLMLHRAHAKSNPQHPLLHQHRAAPLWMEWALLEWHGAHDPDASRALFQRGASVPIFFQVICFMCVCVCACVCVCVCLCVCVSGCACIYRCVCALRAPRSVQISKK
jgi:hypothetical protein